MEYNKTFDVGPNSYHLTIDRANPNVISGGDPDRIQKLADNFLEGAQLFRNRGLLTAHGTYKGIPITAFSTGMGPASVNITLPEVIEACDDDDMLLIRIGTAGGFNSKLGVGHYLVTDQALRDETTSDKIMGRDYLAFASPDFREVIKETAASQLWPGQEAHVCDTVTTNGIYFGEDESLANTYPTGFGISMEFSVFCAIRDWYNANTSKRIKSGNLLRVSNIVKGVESEYQVPEGVVLPNKEEIELAHIKTGLDALVAMRKKMS